jgi:hypothetical protein
LSSLTDIRGIGPALAKALGALGITSPELLARADPSALMQVRGISTDRAQGFIEAAAALGAEGGSGTPAAPPNSEAGAKPAKAKAKADKKKAEKASKTKKADKKKLKKDDKSSAKAKKKSGKAAKDKSKKKKKSGKSKK